MHNMRKRLMWSPEEDQALKRYVEKHGHGNWNEVARLSGLQQQQRCPKSCRLRWMNYLKPGLKRGCFSPQEVGMLLSLHNRLGNRWSQIAAYLPGRSDNDVKNFWHTTARRQRRTMHQLGGADQYCTSERNPDLTATTQDHTSLQSAGPNMVDPHLVGKSSGCSTIAVGGAAAAAPGSPTSAPPPDSSFIMPPEGGPGPEGLHLVVWSFMNRPKSPHVPL